MATPLALPLAALAGTALFNEYQHNKQYDQNIELWQMQNEFNLPVNQVKRLRDAGLNPLYYGLDGNTAGTPQPAPTPDTQNPMQSALMASQIELQKANANLMNEEAEKAKSEAEKNKSETDLNTQQWAFNKVNNMLTLKANRYNVNVILPAQYEQTVANTQFIRKQTTSLEKQWDLWKNQIDEIKSRIDLMDEEFRAKYLENQLNLSTFEMRKKLLELGVIKTGEDINYQRAVTENVRRITHNLVTENDIMEKQLSILKMTGLSRAKRELDLLKVQHDTFEYNLGFARKYGTAQFWFNNINQTASTVIDGVGTVLDYRLGKKRLDENIRHNKAGEILDRAEFSDRSADRAENTRYRGNEDYRRQKDFDWKQQRRNELQQRRRDRGYLTDDELDEYWRLHH